MKTVLFRLIIAFLIFISAILTKQNEYVSLALFIISYLIIGGDVVFNAFKNIAKGELLDENFLMSVATIGAFIIGEYPEAVAVMLFYQTGELFQSYAVNRSKKSITSLMKIRPEYANLVDGDEITKIDPANAKIGDTIIIRPGERIPLDCVVISGDSMIDTAALTGESIPKEATAGTELLNGCININGVIRATVSKKYSESTVSKIIELVENANSKKSNSEKFITKFARYYTPAVVAAAVIIATLPPLLIDGATFAAWGYIALTFLVISCPCALVISIPLSFFGGIGGASKRGILIKGGNYLETLANAEIVVFDKTGTLTKGVFNVQKINGINTAEDELIKVAAHAESHSSHPISKSIKSHFAKEIDNKIIVDVKEYAGYGVQATIDGKTIIAGNEKLMINNSIAFDTITENGTVVHVAIDGNYAGNIVIADEIKPDSLATIKDLRGLGIKQIAMLTGDNKAVANDVAIALGVDSTYPELLPADKVAVVEKLLLDKSAKGKLIFVGDGINDAPVLARADVGVAMGGLGSDAAIEAADVVIMKDEPHKLVEAIKISRRTLRIVKQNIAFILTVKFVVLALGAVGFASMWGAVFADVGVSVLATLNASRALMVKKI